MPITINGSGTVTGISAGGLPDAIITQADLATGVAGTGPAFSAYLGTTQSFSANTWTKTTLQSKDYDTSNAYDNSTNYRFQPTIAGYYQFNACLCFTFTGTSTILGLSLVKNGSNLFDMTVYANTTTGSTINTSKTIYLNGSTDYVELYMYMGGGTSPSLVGPSAFRNFFQGFLARTA